MVYIYTKFYESISMGFRVTDSNGRVKARVVANVDAGWTYGRMHERTNRRKTGSLYRVMPKAGVTIKCHSYDSWNIYWKKYDTVTNCKNYPESFRKCMVNARADGRLNVIFFFVTLHFFIM